MKNKALYQISQLNFIQLDIGNVLALILPLNYYNSSWINQILFRLLCWHFFLNRKTIYLVPLAATSLTNITSDCGVLCFCRAQMTRISPLTLFIQSIFNLNLLTPQLYSDVCWVLSGLMQFFFLPGLLYSVRRHFPSSELMFYLILLRRPVPFQDWLRVVHYSFEVISKKVCDYWSHNALFGLPFTYSWAHFFRAFLIFAIAN